MKKLLQINSVVNWGSTGRIAEGIGEIAINNGWESYIAYGRNEGNSLSTKIRIGNSFDIYTHILKTRILDRHGFASKRSTEKFISFVNEIKPDIIHLHNLHGYYINIEILFHFLSKINTPVVWTLHDCWAFTGHCAYFDYINCQKWQTHCKDCPQKKDYPSSCIIDNSFSNFKTKKQIFTRVEKLTIVPVSDWLSNLTAQSFLKNKKKQVIKNGIDTNIFKPSKNNLIRKKLCLENKFILLGVASVWDRRKGLNDYISLSKYLEANDVIVLVGLNTFQIKNLPENIIGIERTENINELVDLYSSADLYLNLSWEDNFPTTNLESLACGTPVLTYNTGGSPEAISHDTGFIVKKGDIQSITKAIKLFKINNNSNYAYNCRNRVLSNFKMEVQFEKYFNLYEELL
ncbi:MAG: glycosyltransferase [Porphyromonadaceae bacterium]|nr:glycosyltransferase [Porphyromonadaceae bacterium]